jgi:hypothetical protein
MMKVFLSGSRSISRLALDMQQRLDNIIANELAVVVGDANGADKAMQKYLAGKHYTDVSVYFVGVSPRNNLGYWSTVNVEVEASSSGWEYYAHKDKRMAQLADYGLVLWDGESAGSIHNVFELLKNGKKVVVFYNPSKTFLNVNTREDAVRLLNTASNATIKSISEKIKISRYLKPTEAQVQTAFCF